MLLVWKGIDTVVEPTMAHILISIFSVAGGASLLCSIFILPYLWRRIIHEDWQIRWFHVWKGPLLLRLPPPPPPPTHIKANIKDYYRGHMNVEELRILRESEAMMHSVQSSSSAAELMYKDEEAPPQPSDSQTAVYSHAERLKPPRPTGDWWSQKVLRWRIARILFHGLEQDVITMQKRSALLSWNIEDMHARAPRYDNRAEYMYSALQIMTASAASFIHGANDVSNAMGPFTSAYYVWRTGRVESKAPVPVWIL